MVYAAGPLRLLLIVALGFIVYLVLPFRIRAKGAILTPLVIAAAVIVPIGFLLVQINAFEIFSLILILTGFYVWRALNLDISKPFWGQLAYKKASLLRKWVTVAEKDAPMTLQLHSYIVNRWKDIKLKYRRNHLILPFTLAILVMIATYLSRSFFYEYDLYSLSALWQQDLLVVKNLANQQWFVNSQATLGEYVWLVVYKYITNISWVSALHSFALLESAAIAGMLFWYVYRLTHKSISAALLAGLSFAFLYGILFLDIGTLTQHKAVFFSFLFFLPACILIHDSDSRSPKKLFWLIWPLCLAISLSSLFVSLVMLPLYFLASLPWIRQVYKRHYWAAILSYTSATALVLILYAIVSFANGKSFGVFLTQHLYAVSNYTYLPQLLLSYSGYLYVTVIILLLSGVVLITLWLKEGAKWGKLLSFQTFFGLLLLLTLLENRFFDQDMLNQAIAVCSPIFIATVFYGVYSLVKSSIFPEIPLPTIYKIVFSLLLVGWIVLLQKNNYWNLPRGNEITTDIVQTYSQIEENYMPYSYAVVNLSKHIPLSTHSHFFIHYEVFGSSYLEVDNTYANRKKDKQFLKENPQLVLPSSTFLFLYPPTVLDKLEPREKALAMEQAQHGLEVLKKRQREIRLFYKSANLKVYEIINQPGEATYTDLLARKFKNRDTK
jgi:hypothetical protein